MVLLDYLIPTVDQEVSNMANLRTNKLVGIGSTDAGVVFDGEIKFNTPNVMYFPTGITSERGRGRGVFGSVKLQLMIR